MLTTMNVLRLLSCLPNCLELCALTLLDLKNLQRCPGLSYILLIPFTVPANNNNNNNNLYSTEEAITFLVDKVIHFKAQETNNDAIMLQETRPQNSKYKASCCG
jgi:hypothetical protein